MNIDSAYPSRFLKASSLEGRDLVVTMNFVQIETIGQGVDKAEKPCLYFSDRLEGLVLNKTNAATITKLYGADTDAWFGKRIILYPTETQMGTEMKDCIRIRPVRDNAANGQAGPAAPGATNPGMAPAQSGLPAGMQTMQASPSQQPTAADGTEAFGGPARPLDALGEPVIGSVDDPIPF